MPFRIGDWTVTPALNLVTRGDRPVHVRRQLMDLVVFLARHQGQVVSKEEIFQAVWPGQFVAETGLARCISQLRDVFEDDAREPRVIQTIPTRGYRLLPLVGPVEPETAPETAAPASASAPATEPAPAVVAPPAAVMPVALAPAVVVPPAAVMPVALAPTVAAPAIAAPAVVAPAVVAPPMIAPAIVAPSRRRWWFAAIVVGAVAAAMAVYAAWPRRQPQALGERDSVLVAFENRTGDTVFDDTLHLALSMHLEQSPYLRVVAADRVREALAFMNRPADTRVTRALSLELCQRVGAKAVLAGSLAAVGQKYVISLEGLGCESGRPLAQQQVEVAGRELVLEGLGRAVLSMRERLGESVASIRRFDVPIAQVSTSSFDALKALSQGDYERARGRDEDAERWFRRAIELDPSFAMAHMRLSVHLFNIDRYGEGLDSLRRAYAARERASEGERLYIESFYFNRVRRDPIKAVVLLERWRDIYPRHVVPRFTLASLYLQMGRLEQALEQVQEALRLEPEHALAIDVRLETLTALGRFADARRVGEALIARRRGDVVTHVVMLDLAQAVGQPEAVRRELEWGATTPVAQVAFLELEAALARWGGRLREGSGLTRRRILASDQRGDALAGALSAIAEATDRALLGQAAEPRALALDAVRRARTPDTLIRAALALALAGEAGEARRLLRDYETMPDVDAASDPDYKPALLAALALGRGEPAAAIESLAPLRPYDMGWRFGFLPSYLRGEALLRLGRPADAVAEFERITTNPGILPTSVIHPLGWLQLARARAAAGNGAMSRTAYETVLRQWKDADPDVPSLLEARAELARMR